MKKVSLESVGHLRMTPEKMPAVDVGVILTGKSAMLHVTFKSSWTGRSGGKMFPGQLRWAAIAKVFQTTWPPSSR